MTAATSFDRLGPAAPASPLVISVPHAGRDYPAALLANLRAPVAAARSLEDRWVDAVALAARGEDAMLVARRARAWIDLNRSEAERDPRVDEGAPGAATSAKLRSGLGLVPRRSAVGGELWRRRWTAAEVEARIAADHRPYHDALAAALAGARARFGVAVLLDLHSMPPLGGPNPARLVLGDRFGRAAGGRFVARAHAAAATLGLIPALNQPYAGGHILERHGDHAAGVHAIQLEVDRSLYLDAALDRVDPAGLPRVARVVRAVMDALADEALGGGALLAAE